MSSLPDGMGRQPPPHVPQSSMSFSAADYGKSKQNPEKQHLLRNFSVPSIDPLQQVPQAKSRQLITADVTPEVPVPNKKNYYAKETDSNDACEIGTAEVAPEASNYPSAVYPDSARESSASNAEIYCYPTNTRANTESIYQSPQPSQQIAQAPANRTSDGHVGEVDDLYDFPSPRLHEPLERVTGKVHGYVNAPPQVCPPTQEIYDRLPKKHPTSQLPPSLPSQSSGSSDEEGGDSGDYVNQECFVSMTHRTRSFRASVTG